MGTTRLTAPMVVLGLVLMLGTGLLTACPAAEPDPTPTPTVAPAPTPTPAPPPAEPPDIPHPVAGFEDCTRSGCHLVGGPGVGEPGGLGMPSGHAGFSGEQCVTCHQPS